MKILAILWLCLITIIQPAQNLMVTVNSNGNFFCCLFGSCTCNSFSNALLFIRSNTVINITSPVVSMDTLVFIQKVSNITITSKNGTTVTCSSVGSLRFIGCSNVTIEAITWNHCGNMNLLTLEGIGFYNSVSNISIINCTFQHFVGCVTVYISNTTGAINVVNSKFMFNTISNTSVCGSYMYSTLLVTSSGNISIAIYNSLFYNNSYQGSGLLNGSLYISSENQRTQSVLIKNSSFISNGIRSMYINRGTKVTFDKVNVSDNRFSTYIWVYGILNVISSQFTYNNNRALYVLLANHVKVELFNSTFANNSAPADTFGTAISVNTGSSSTVNISLCNIYDNIGGNSIVYINTHFPFDHPSTFNNVLITASNFKNNKNGSALQVAKCFLKFYSTTLFQDNSARSGAALYIRERSQISVDNGSTVQFINNTALLRGGAMYIDLTNCYDHGIVFTNFTRYDSISFINNSAKLSGNSIYFDIPSSCDVIRDYTNNDSAAYVPYKFNYSQSRNVIGPAVVASPYEIKLCTFDTKCDCINGMNNSTYVIEDDVMLGEFAYFNAMLCDYFNTAAEATKLQVNCINCNFKYRPLDDEVLIQNRSSNSLEILSLNANTDLENYANIILNLSSRFSPEYKQLTGTLAIKLSPCYNGYIFNKESQQCECYSKDDHIQCEEDNNANIKLGHWFGIFAGKHIISLCHYDYCNFFTHRKETRSGFYNLPEEIDDQCNSHRTGIACGQCNEGYTLAYNSPDCISVEECSPGMLALVVALSAFYSIAIIIMLFGVAYYLNTQQISLGCLYSITFFYSIVDILLVTNLHLTDRVFYTATILSSFAKLNPQFLGRLCFLGNLDAIDQQFIHYCHVVFISIILMVIYIMAKCNNRALMYVNRGIMQVTCFVLLFSYTSLTSTSLLLLRAVKFEDIDGLYTYLSPYLKYFANRHAGYASVAVLCVLLVTIGFPLLLVVEPLVMKVFNEHFNNKDRCITNFMKRQACFARIKQLLDQLQDCYKDQYRWFAAYYLICRLVIMLITYFANDDYNYMIYYLQVACVVIAMTHIWIQPYKNDLLNVLDSVILLIMLLTVNLSAFSFSISTTAAVAISLILSPLLLLLGIGVKKLIIIKFKKIQPNLENNFDLELRPIPK